MKRKWLVNEIKKTARSEAIPWLLILEDMDACEEAIHWCIAGRFRTLKAAWEVCEDATYMCWLVPRCNYGPVRRKKFLRAVLEIARSVEKYSPAAQECNDVLERYLDGEATEEELARAARAAADVAYAARAAADVAYAAYAAADAAYAAYAAADVARAARAAAYAARAAADAACAAAYAACAAADAACAAAYAENLKKSSDIIRKWVKCPKLHKAANE